MSTRHNRLETPASGSRGMVVTRRAFVYRSVLATAASTLLRTAPGFLVLEETASAGTDSVRDALNGLLAFVVPGNDAYSTAQGETTVEPGGCDAGVMGVLVHTLDLSAPFLPSFSAVIAGILNQLAQAVNPNATAPFAAPFANLAFAEKAVVFQIMDSTDSLKSLGGVLPAFVAYVVYSDASVLDPVTRSLSGRPLGWTLSNYAGVSEGRSELRGYYGNRRGVSPEDRDDEDRSDA